MGNFFYKRKTLDFKHPPSPFKNTIVYIMKYMGHSSSNKYYILHLRNDNVNICISDEKEKLHQSAYYIFIVRIWRKT